MSPYFRRLCWLGTICILMLQPASAEQQYASYLEERIRLLLGDLDSGELRIAEPGEGLKLSALNIRIKDCTGDPYSESPDASRAARTLVDDLRRGLRDGLQCLVGRGPQGKLESYHRYQAQRLLELLEAPPEKTFLCVEDARFATAVATRPKGVTENDALFPQLRLAEHPTVIFDTCCFGGSDCISDSARNDVHQQTACNILKYDELWSRHNSPYRQMRLWHYKGYDRLKTLMRSDYDP